MANILIVDDQQMNREVLGALLKYAGHQLLEASDGAEALESAQRNHPDLVITDILMPVMDGYEFVKHLRADHSIAHTPVIYYTAHYLEREARALAEKSGITQILPKPFEAEQVWSVVETALGVAAESPRGALTQTASLDREHLDLVTNKLSQKVAELRLAKLRFEALIELGRELNTESDPSALVSSYCRATREIVGAELSLIRLSGAAHGAGAVFTSGFSKDGCPNLIDCFESPGIFRDIEELGAARRICSLDGEPIEIGGPGRELVVRSLVAAPIASRLRQYGWLYAFNKLGNLEFNELEGQLATMLAGQLAVAYEKASLYEEAARRAVDLEREVVERKRAEEAVRQSESQYRMLMEQASDGIAIFDAQGYCVEVNPVFCRMLGRNLEDLLGKKMASLIPQEDANFDPAGRRERRLARKDGKYVLAEIGASILEDGREQLIMRDVTDRRALEEQLRQSQKMDALGRLAGGVAHDFNNLLTAIIGYGDVALQTLPEGTELRSHVEEILVAAERAAVLTSQLLACSRKQVMQPRVLDLNTVVANITKLSRRVLGENVDLVLNLGTDLGPVRVDSGQIEQVILNLAINARDAMPDGGKLVVETGQVDIDEDYLRTHIAFQSGRYLTLTISDTGSGISADVLPHIFEPFFTTKMPGKGTGLGLSIVHGIVTQSGGYIAAYSEPGFGTTFRIYLPTCAEAPARPTRERRGWALPRGTETVLLVEDDAIVRGVERSILRTAGYTVLEAENGAEAIRVLDNCGWGIDVLLTDIIMPGMNGKALADLVLSRRPDIALIYCSGYAEDVIVHHGILASGVAFLQKPFTPRALAHKLRETLDAYLDADPIVQGCPE